MFEIVLFYLSVASKEFCKYNHFLLLPLSDLPNVLYQTESGDADLYAYVTYLPPQTDPFVAGVAWFGTLCYNNSWTVFNQTNTGKGFRLV